MFVPNVVLPPVPPVVPVVPPPPPPHVVRNAIVGQRPQLAGQIPQPIPPNNQNVKISVSQRGPVQPTQPNVKLNTIEIEKLHAEMETQYGAPLDWFMN